MAEIPIQRKERSRLWPMLLLLLLVVIAVGWYVWSRNGGAPAGSAATGTSNGALVTDSTAAATATPAPGANTPPR